jgi:hypothetical protein
MCCQAVQGHRKVRPVWHSTNRIRMFQTELALIKQLTTDKRQRIHVAYDFIVF